MDADMIHEMHNVGLETAMASQSRFENARTQSAPVGEACVRTVVNGYALGRPKFEWKDHVIC